MKVKLLTQVKDNLLLRGNHAVGKVRIFFSNPQPGLGVFRKLKGSHLLILGFLVLIPGLLSCAGSGRGLDENGDPIGTPQVCPPNLPLAPTLPSLQANIFGPICTRCHAGAQAPLGLVLDCGQSYDMMVGILSVERDDLYRVNPGSPDDSYLIMKLEGATGIVGDQMPLGMTPLTQEQIDAVRAWIAAGASEQ